MIRAVIFDMDGVIADTMTLDFIADYNVLRSIGVVESEQDYVRAIGKPARQVYLEILAEKGIKADIDSLLGKREEEVEKFIAGKMIQPSKGLKELIKSLKDAGYRIGMASSSSRRKIENVLESLKLRKEFSAIVSADDVKSNKPAPDIYIEAASRLNLGVEECIAIEDSPTGIASAKSSGMKCIALRTRHVPEDGLKQADLIVESLSRVDAKKLENI